MPTNWDAIAPITAHKSKEFMNGQPNSQNTVAFCHNTSHLGALSKDMLKQHQCLQKNCKYLEKKEDHPYWKQRYWHKVTKAREKKYKKFHDNYVHPGVKKTTGKLLKVSSSNINSDFSQLLQFLEEQEIIHTYLFYKDGTMKMKYLGGFYGRAVAIEEAMKNIRKGQGQYLLIASEESAIEGFRIEQNSKKLLEIDLTWGYLYPALSKLVKRDIELRQKTA